MKIKILIFAAILSTINSQLTTVFAQGVLTPPGVPAPTMKSLDQIEPRTPISSVPFTISSSGSYYLTTNFTVASGGAITISANGVTLDLNGFTLVGNASYQGIVFFSGLQSARIFNGNLTGWYSGADASGASGVTFENVKATGNTYIGLAAGKDAQFTRCVVTSNYFGIYLTSNGRVADCVADANAYGISAGNNCSLTGCTASGSQNDNFTTGQNCVVSQCAAYQSVNGNGFNLNVGNTVTGCSATGNKLDGFLAGNRSTVENCTATFNGRAGIHCNFLSTAQQNTCANNGSYGIFCDAAGYAYILQNNCTFNGLLASSGSPTNGAGIWITNSPACRVEGNMVTYDYYGIVVAAGSGALVTRNDASSSVVSAYSIGTGNSYGPIVTTSGLITTNSPYANFIH